MSIKKIKKDLTDKQEAFCREYVKDFNAVQSCIRAGYSKRTADKQGSQLLGKTSIAQKIAQLKEQKITREQKLLDQSYGVLRDSLDFDPASLCNEDGTFKNLNELDHKTRHILLAFQKTGQDIKVKFPEKARLAIEFFKGMGIFKPDNANVETQINVQIINYPDVPA